MAQQTAAGWQSVHYRLCSQAGADVWAMGDVSSQTWLPSSSH